MLQRKIHLSHLPAVASPHIVSLPCRQSLKAQPCFSRSTSNLIHLKARSASPNCATGWPHEIDGFLVPRADEHQGEYVAARSERLQWLTGFTGSAGAALVLMDQALVFVDGRYTLQVKQQTDHRVHDREPGRDTTVQMARQKCRQGARIGFDPWLHTTADARALRTELGEARRDACRARQQPDR
jgi:hypothetical protein